MPRKPHDHRTLPRSIILLESRAFSPGNLYRATKPLKQKKLLWGFTLPPLRFCIMWGASFTPRNFFWALRAVPPCVAVFAKCRGERKIFFRVAPSPICPSPSPPGFPRLFKKEGFAPCAPCGLPCAPGGMEVSGCRFGRKPVPQRLKGGGSREEEKNANSSRAGSSMFAFFSLKGGVHAAPARRVNPGHTLPRQKMHGVSAMRWTG
jgi:hypothetical protein